MSTIKADNIATLAGVSTSMANAVNGSAKAWVNFNGTGTVAIRGSYNVSSITDNGSGNYTVNFTTAMPDANYSAVSSAVRFAQMYVLHTATQLGVVTQDLAGTNSDDTFVQVAVFR